MKLSRIIANILIFFTIIIFPITSFANIVEKDESGDFYTDLVYGEGNFAIKAIFNISKPGAGHWVINGKKFSTMKMPACFIILGKNLNLDKFVKEIEITTKNGKKLLLMHNNGTVIFLDKNPSDSENEKELAEYTIGNKRETTFGKLIYLAGGSRASSVTMYFDRGCNDIATKPFLPNE